MNMLDEFGSEVYEYCDIFKINLTDKDTGAERKICWPLGNDLECRKQGVDRDGQKQQCRDDIKQI